MHYLLPTENGTHAIRRPRNRNTFVACATHTATPTDGVRKVIRSLTRAQAASLLRAHRAARGVVRRTAW